MGFSKTMSLVLGILLSFLFHFVGEMECSLTITCRVFSFDVESKFLLIIINFHATITIC